MRKWNNLLLIAVILFFLWSAFLITSSLQIRSEVSDNVELISNLNKLESQITASQQLFSNRQITDSLLADWDPVFSLITKNTEDINAQILDLGEQYKSLNLKNRVKKIVEDYHRMKAQRIVNGDLSNIRTQSIEKIRFAQNNIKTAIALLRRNLTNLSQELSNKWDQLYIITIITSIITFIILLFISKPNKSFIKRKNEGINKELFSNMLKQMDHAVVVLNNTRQIEFVNKKFLELSGRAKFELIDSKITEFDLDYRYGRFFKDINQMISEMEIEKCKFFTHNFNGKEQILLFSVQNIKDKINDKNYFLILIYDVTMPLLNNDFTNIRNGADGELGPEETIEKFVAGH